MKHIIAVSIIAASTLGAAAEAPLWMRDARISPDGKNIAFTYKGDIFTVPVGGRYGSQAHIRPCIRAVAGMESR